MNVGLLERAVGNTSKLLSNVSADQLDAPTPCESWQVRNLVNHIVGGSHWFAMSMDAGASPEGAEEPDFAGGDFVSAYADGSSKAIAAFGAEGALGKNVKLPFGEFPGAAFLGLAIIDTFQHGWDLARATGQDSDIDPELATQLLAAAKASVPDKFRGPDGVAPFGASKETDSASPADQLAAFLGRTV